MRAALYEAFREALELREVKDPVCPPHGAIIEVKANGICRSDWHGWMGHDPSIRLPHVPGHELAGMVLEVGSGVKHWRPGARVTVPFCCGCGYCAQCLGGQQHICDNDYQPGFSGWGAFAQYVAIPQADLNLVALPESMGFVAAASLGCRFMTAFHGLVDQGGLRAGEWVAVFGCGGVGLSAVMIASALGARVIAVDIEDGPLELAQTLGAEHTLNAARESARALLELSDGGVHVSVDALGSKTTCVQAIRSLRKRGRHVQIGLMLAQDARPAIPMHLVIAKELSLIGSHGMPPWRYPTLLGMIEAGILHPEKLIGKEIALAEAGDVLTKMGDFQQQGVTVITSF